ncbi:MAG: phenylalanyl-tRNA synthetase beta chain [Verrucomicrobiota bacterium]|jgi:phenylalanyl-tRNA synthetase beta chain
MKFSVNWLRDFVDLPENVQDLAELLTLAGVEIEEIRTTGADIDKVIVAQIATSSPHPNADRLTVCEVEEGSGMKRQIVCGATNFKAGDKVALALPGAVLPNGLKIRASKLRRVESEGMLCSAIELGLGQDSAGLLILSPAARIGAPISEFFPNDTVLDVEITPNRGDLLSHFGLAREIAALTGIPLREPKLPTLAAATLSGVKISAPRECPFYSARRIENVKVGPSPDWLRAKIESVGIRSVNNIVDISNFVMLELGQPTHAFDADKLRGGIEVRMARDGEKFLALDGKTYSLTTNELVIADATRAVGIGGVMGGEETGVSESTRNVLLEAAYFLPSSVRRTARILNLPSDASYRFERGVDPGMILRASERAVELMREITGAKPVAEVSTAGELPANPSDISLRYDRSNRLLGIRVEETEVDQILERFGLRKNQAAAKEGASVWNVPSHRRDLQREVDLIEEVVRVHGVQQIAGTDRSRFTPSSTADRAHDRETALRLKLVSRGLDEARTSKLIPRNASAFSENAVQLRNPLSEDHVALRPSLIGGLLDVLGRNIRAGAERVAIFEIGRVFLPPEAKEERHIGILLWGNMVDAVHWRTHDQQRFDLFDIKGAVESLLTSKVSFCRSQHRDYRDFSLAMEIIAENNLIGVAGQLSSAFASRIDATGAVFVAEIVADAAFEGVGCAATFAEFGKFPAVKRDIAMIVPESLSHEQIYDEILRVTEPMLEHVDLFDVFTGKDAQHIGPGRKSLAYTLTYRDKNRTLTGEEVNAAHARIRERLQSELGAELRE